MKSILIEIVQIWKL